MINSFYSRLTDQSNTILNPKYIPQQSNQFNMNDYETQLKKRPSYTLDKFSLFTSSYYNPNTNQYIQLTDADLQFLKVSKGIDTLLYSLFKLSNTKHLEIVQTYIISI